MDKSVLESIKHYLGIYTECDSFNTDVMMHVNSALSTLYQIGVDSARNTLVDNDEVTWYDIFSEDEDLLPMIKQYIFLKVRLVFDPPTSSFVLESMNKMIDELEWRIHIEAEGGFEDLPQVKGRKFSKNRKEEDF